MNSRLNTGKTGHHNDEILWQGNRTEKYLLRMQADNGTE